MISFPAFFGLGSGTGPGHGARDVASIKSGVGRHVHADTEAAEAREQHASGGWGSAGLSAGEGKTNAPNSSFWFIICFIRFGSKYKKRKILKQQRKTVWSKFPNFFNMDNFGYQ